MCAALTGEAGIPLEDFPLKQSRDKTLKHDFDQMRVINVQRVQRNARLSNPYFVLSHDTLY